MTREELKKTVCAAIAARRNDILALGNAIYAEPELGYKEAKTAAKVEAIYKKLGIPYETGLALTGIKGRLKGKSSRRTVAVLGELDAVVCADHPKADPISGAAHCCGHNVQVAVMAAVGMGLKDAGIMEHLDGDVVLFAVPAEEYVELTYRDKLRSEGKIEYIGGKPELIRIGAFDDIDMALQMHVDTLKDPERVRSKKGLAALSTTSNGFIGKLVRYKGRAAHAAAAPDMGINALQACMMGVTAVNALRERFRDSDHVRFHPIITHGGDLVNVVPSDVRMESYVRAGSVDALKLYNEQVNRALGAGATALGAEVEIRDMPGYLPLNNDANLNDIFGSNMAAIIGTDRVTVADHLSGSTDTGELSQIMPVCHPWIAGITGTLHSKDYEIVDESLVYIEIAQAFAMCVIDLLYGDAVEAERVVKEFKPILSKQGLMDFLQGIKKTTVVGAE